VFGKDAFPDIPPQAGSGSFAFNANIPADTKSGLYDITAVGLGDNDYVTMPEMVMIYVAPQSIPTNIRISMTEYSPIGNPLKPTSFATLGPLTLNYPGARTDLHLDGMLQDGSVTSLTQVPITNWKSNNESVVTIDGNGWVTAVNAGKTTIDVTYQPIASPQTVLTASLPVEVLNGSQCPTCNSQPIANAGSDKTVECTGPTSTPVTLDGTLSSDPYQGNPLTFLWKGSFGTASGPTPTVSLPLGVNPIALTVDNGTLNTGGTATASVNVTVKDTTSSVLSAALVPVKVEKTEGTFKVTYSCSDICSANPMSSATLNGKLVTNNQLVNLEVAKKAGSNTKNGILSMEASTFILTASCKDTSRNTSNATVSPVFKK